MREKTYLLLPGREGAELASLGDGPALAGGGVLLSLDGRPIDDEILVVTVDPHGDQEALRRRRIGGAGEEARAGCAKRVPECREREERTGREKRPGRVCGEHVL